MKSTVLITAKDNQLIKNVVKLQSSARFRRECSLFVLEGMRLCEDALENGVRFEKILFTQGFREKNQDMLNRFLDNSDESFEVSEVIFNKISDTHSPQGIISLCRMAENQDFKFKENGKYLALENIADPSNLGAICRSAEALGIDGIIVSSNGCDPYSPKVLRASMGTVLRMPVYITLDFINLLKDNKLTKYACVVNECAEKLTDIKFNKGCICLIGNEGSGLSDEAVNLCEYSITIPMSGRVESLNASVAAAIVMWEMVK